MVSCAPRRSKPSARWEPIKPAPPVSKMRPGIDCTLFLPEQTLSANELLDCPGAFLLQRGDLYIRCRDSPKRSREQNCGEHIHDPLGHARAATQDRPGTWRSRMP